jgi:cytidylate kinase
MPIILISRGSYSRGKEVADKVAERLGYESVAREVLLQASQEFDVDVLKLMHAVRDSPSFFNRISYGKERYVAYIRAALLAHLKRDNVVYHGLAGHFFVRDVGHALKVRITADIEDRIRLVMQRDGISEKAAARFIKQIDKERRDWSRSLYGIDNTDPNLYDLVLHIQKLTVDDAADVICHTAGLEHLQATDESRRTLEDDALASAVKAVLVKEHPDAEVTAEDGAVYVCAKTTDATELRTESEIRKLAQDVPGVKDVEVRLRSYIPFGI